MEATKEPPESLLLRVPSAAAILGIGVKTSYRWIEAGVLPKALLLRVGKSSFIRRPASLGWLSANGEKKKR